MPEVGVLEQGGERTAWWWWGGWRGMMTIPAGNIGNIVPLN